MTGSWGKGRLAAALDWTFRDRTTGGITIGQWPNLSMWLFIALTVLGWGASANGSPAAAFWLTLAADAVLIWWAMDEVLRGVNPWRRGLGGATVIGLAVLFLMRGVT